LGENSNSAYFAPDRTLSVLSGVVSEYPDKFSQLVEEEMIK
jgi:hypothetical protein